MLIVNPGIHISTKDAFSNITPKENIFDYSYFQSVEEPDYSYLNDNIKNDFEDFVFSNYQSIKDISELMLNSNALFSRMSGTGSTVYGIFDNSEDAEKVIDLLPNEYFFHLTE